MSIVLGEGPTDAEVVLIGDHVGVEEMRRDKNFCGVAGEELNSYLKTAGLARSDCYITNLVKWVKGKKPTTAEYERFKPLLLKELSGLNPKVIVPMGAEVVTFLLDETVSDVCGRHIIRDGQSYVPVYNPAYGLRKSRYVPYIQSAFRTVRRVLDGVEPTFEPADAKDLDVYYEDSEERGSLYRELESKGGVVCALDTETENGKLFSCGVAWREGTALFIPREDEEALKLVFRKAERLIMHNAKFDLRILKVAGFEWTGPFDDTMVMAHISEEPLVGLKTLIYNRLWIRMQEYEEIVSGFGTERAIEYLKHVSEAEWLPDAEQIRTVRYGEVSLRKPTHITKRAKRILNDYEKDDTTDVRRRWSQISPKEGRRIAEREFGKMPEPTVADVPRDTLRFYGCLDADMTLRLYKCLDVSDQQTAYDLDIGMIPMLVDMENRGIKADMHFAEQELRKKLESERAKAEFRLQEAAGLIMNPNSSDQVKRLLKNLGISQVETTDRQHLSQIKLKVGDSVSDIIDLILACREHTKMLGTYVNNIHNYLDEDDVVRTDFRITGTETGRLSSASPNLQNQPSRTKTGRLLRDVYVARPGYVLCGTDFSQIEMRVAAHVSEDPVMMSMFERGADIHTETAARMYNVDPEDVTKEQRYTAKRVGFGTLYGLSGKGLYILYIMEGIYDHSLKSCYKQIDAWFEVFQGVEAWVQETRDFVRRNGYVVDMFGRRRSVREAQASTSYVAEEGYRKAVNMPIQSGAGNILKIAMNRLHNNPEIRYGEAAFPLLQIHDEILWEIEECAASEIVPKILEIMSNCYTLKVPIEADAEIGKRWGSLQK